jgi:hypothetical protein
MTTQKNRFDEFKLLRDAREVELEMLEKFRIGKAEAPQMYKQGQILDDETVTARIRSEMDGETKGVILPLFIASDESVDSYGDIIRQKGWDLKRFKSNPVFPWMHNYDVPPPGTVPSIKVDMELLALVNSVLFDTADPFAQLLAGKYDRGVLRAESVAFRTKEYKLLDEEDDSWFPAIEFLEQELLEISGVTIPANPNALQIAAFGTGKFFSIPETDPATVQLSSEDRELLRAAVASINGLSSQLKDNGCVPLNAPQTLTTPTEGPDDPDDESDSLVESLGKAMEEWNA